MSIYTHLGSPKVPDGAKRKQEHGRSKKTPIRMQHGRPTPLELGGGSGGSHLLDLAGLCVGRCLRVTPYARKVAVVLGPGKPMCPDE